MQELGMNEAQVKQGLVLASKLNKGESEMLNKIKAGAKKEDIFAEVCREKYK